MATKRVLNKRCNVVTKGDVIVTTSRRIVGKLDDTYLTAGEIIQCLQRKAYVEEILIDGTTLQLNISNYDKDNNTGLKPRKKEDHKVVLRDIPKTKKPHVVDVVRDELEKAPEVKEEVLNPLGLTPVDKTVFNINEAPVEEIKEKVKEESVEEEVTEVAEEDAPTELPSEEEK